MNPDGKMWLRHTFVGMLFALAVAETAKLFGDLFAVVAYGWDHQMSVLGLIARMSSENFLLLAPASHLVLGLVLVAKSWVGWSRSKAAGNSKEVDDIYSILFVLLMLELILVVLYFILIGSVELDVNHFMRSYDLQDAVPSPSAAPEAALLCVIFVAYALWDLISDVYLGPVKSKHIPFRDHPYISRSVTYVTGTITYSFVSVICALLAFYIQINAKEVSSPIAAVYGDLSLICLLYLFRSGKSVERFFLSLFPWEQHRKGSRGPDNNKLAAIVKVITPLVLIFWLLALMRDA